MKRPVCLALAAAFPLLVTVAVAKAPTELKDLIGARAPGAESEMQKRGYVDVKNNSWWKADTKTCVRVHVSQGRYSTITQMQPAVCQSASAAAKCPAGTPHYKLNKMPGCTL